MKIKIKHIYILLLISLTFINIQGCEQLNEDYNQPEYKNPIKIGIVGDVLIGREIAENVFFGIKMAADEINSQGGIELNGEKRKIKLIFKDSEGIAQSGINIVNELIKENVQIIIGPTISAVAVEMANTCIENDILMMTYSATIPVISTLRDKDLVWRTCPSDAFSGRIMAAYAIDSLNLKRGAILFRNDNFGNSMADIIQEKFESLGGEIVERSFYPTNIDVRNYNYDDKINFLLEYEPDIIFAPVFEEEIGKITQDLWYSSLYQELEKKPTLFLTEGAFPKELLTNGQPEVIETILGISSSTTSTDNYMAYKNNYTSKFGFTPNTYSEHAYDALYTIAYAIIKSQSVEPDDIKLELRNVTQNNSPNQEDVVINVNEYNKALVLLMSNLDINYNGASGKISFDENGDPYPSFVIWGLTNDEYIEIANYNK
jgi:branched-chain amino acid transport system substrate-binding protein